MELPLYNQLGKKVGTATLPEKVFGLPWNGDLVHQVSVSLASSARAPLAHTKTRGEVSGTGRKPWKQKGTGQARHGSRRSPIWRTGGVTFGPRNDKNFLRKVNKKMNTKALFVVLSQKLRDGEVLLLDEMKTNEGRAREAQAILQNIGAIKGFERIGKNRGGKTLVFIKEKVENTTRSFKNFKNVTVTQVQNANVLDVLNFRNIVFVDPETTAGVLEKKSPKKEGVETKKRTRAKTKKKGV